MARGQVALSAMKIRVVNGVPFAAGAAPNACEIHCPHYSPFTFADAADIFMMKRQSGELQWLTADKISG